jgi:hypothetical protein
MCQEVEVDDTATNKAMVAKLPKPLPPPRVSHRALVPPSTAIQVATEGQLLAVINDPKGKVVDLPLSDLSEN